jgi:hypothetical protein
VKQTKPNQNLQLQKQDSMLKGNFLYPNPATITKISIKIEIDQVVKTNFQKLSKNNVH